MPIGNSYRQSHFRFRNDDGSETNATWIAAEDTDANIALDTNFRVRISIYSGGFETWTNLTWNLYYSLNNGAYSAVTTSTPVKFSASGNIVDGSDATHQLSASGAVYLTDNNGLKESTGGVVNSGDASKSNYFETEWSLQLDSAQISADNTIDFRIYKSSTALNSYDYTPRATATGGSTQNLTLTCAAGSYSLTGSSVTLTHTPASQNLTLACNAGSFTLTGTNADLTVKRNYVLTCEAGSYSLTGTNASLTSARTLICEPASGGAYPDIIVSGAGTTDANGTYEYFGDSQGKPSYKTGNNLIAWIGLGFDIWGISVDSIIVYQSTDDVATPDLVTTWTAVNDGIAPVPTVTVATTYALTGTDVTLTKTAGAQNLTLTCEAGSYSLTGANVDLTVKRNYTLECSAGTYTLTGTNTEFEVKRNYTFACEAGSFNLTGSDVDFVLQRNYSLVCGAGSYNLTGTDTTLEVKRNYVLECGVGSYTLTGTDTTLTAQFHYSLVCEVGSYTYTGTDISFGNTKSYTLVCEAGSYDLTGSNVSFVIQRNYTFVCEPGSYTYTGTDVTLTYTQGAQNFTLACEAGSYALTGTNTTLTSARTMALESGSYALTGTNADFYRALVMACETGSYALTGTGAGLNVYYAWVTTPACRTLVIVAENRVYAIPFENRTRTVDAENRTFTIKCCGG